MPLLDLVVPKIVSVGAAGPLGLNALQVALCARAGKLEPRSCRVKDKRGASIGVCRARWLSDDLIGAQRLVALGSRALKEALVGVTLEVPLVVSLPEATRPDVDAGSDAAFLQDLGVASGAKLELARSQVIREGHAGFAVAMDAAVKHLLAGAPMVIVGGIDSYFHPDALGWLDTECRLHAEKAEDGILPSEGAAFLVLTSANKVPQGKIPEPIGCLRFVEVGTESEEPYLATVMTSLVRRALEATGEQEGWILSDLNGEQHRLDEWSKVAIRCGLFSDTFRHDRLVDEMGDMGAATGALLLAIACMYWKIDCAPGRSLLMALHSEGSSRGVLWAEKAQ